MSKKIKGKIGYCSNRVLGMGNIGGHYIYVRNVKNGRCDVNIITSIEDKNGAVDSHKLHKVKKGYLYPIPKPDATFPRWSAINLDGNIKNIPIRSVKNIGCHSIKKRHKFFPGKFTKK